jgi:organic radical activating enzyme
VWCDTKYTWDWDHYQSEEELLSVEIPEVVKTLGKLGLGELGLDLLVITGGEPMMQQHGIVKLLEELVEEGLNPERVEIETAGVIAPILEILEFLNVHFNVSPKLGNSGNPLEKRFKPKVLEEFVKTDRAIFKFVVTDTTFSEVLWTQAEAYIPDRMMWIQPEGTDSHTLMGRLKDIAPEAIRMGWNISPRLQIFIWGNVRGV